MLFKIIAAYMRTSPFLFALIITGGLFELLFHYLSALSYRYLIDKALIPKDAQVLVLIVGALLSIGLLSVLAGIAGDYAKARLGSKLLFDYRMKLFGHMQMQTSRFYERFRLGDLLARHTEDIPGVQRAINETITTGFISVLSVATGLALLFSMEWRLTLVAIGGSAIVFIPYRLLKSRSLKLNEAYLAHLGRFTGAIDESVKLHNVIRAFDLRAFMRKRIEDHLHVMLSVGVSRSFVNANLNRLPLLAVAVLTAIILGYGSYLAFNERLTIGAFIAYNSIFITVGQSLFGITGLLSSVLSARTSLRRLQEVLSWQPNVPEHGTRELPRVRREIALRDVSFAYIPDEPVLRGLDIVIPATGYTSIVGASGSGKSTVLQLLLRFEDPAEGAVMYDAVDIRDCVYASLLRQVGIVFQDSVLFNGSIRDTIRIGKPDASEREIEDAARAAGIHDTIVQLREGYDTVVHNQGDNLSGGQRQRIALARALIRNPGILVLDEATSSLDSESERSINETILSLAQNRAVISVTHRLAYAAKSDRIVVLHQGKAVETGTHDELMERRGHYRRMWDKQQGFTLSTSGDVRVDWKRVGQLPFFQGIEQAALQEISRLFVTEKFETGARVVEQGDHGDKLYMIVRGKVEVVVRNPESDERRTVAILEDGDHFGEIALLYHMPRTATVTAITPCICLVLCGADFHPFVIRHPIIRERLEAGIRIRNERIEAQ